MTVPLQPCPFHPFNVPVCDVTATNAGPGLELVTIAASSPCLRVTLRRRAGAEDRPTGKAGPCTPSMRADSQARPCHRSARRIHPCLVLTWTQDKGVCTRVMGAMSRHGPWEPEPQSPTQPPSVPHGVSDPCWGVGGSVTSSSGFWLGRSWSARGHRSPQEWAQDAPLPALPGGGRLLAEASAPPSAFVVPWWGSSSRGVCLRPSYSNTCRPVGPGGRGNPGCVMAAAVQDEEGRGTPRARATVWESRSRLAPLEHPVSGRPSPCSSRTNCRNVSGGGLGSGKGPTTASPSCPPCLLLTPAVGASLCTKGAATSGNFLWSAVSCNGASPASPLLIGRGVLY